MSGAILDQGWLLICAALVFLMQAGFGCLESGLVCAKNNSDVAVTNFADFLVSSLIFWAVGYGLMYGPTLAGLVGSDGFFYDSAAGVGYDAFFVFQLMFCSTAATIVSGAVAERMKYTQYLLGTAVVAGLVYPVFGHWAWGPAGGGGATGFLKGLGFVDFAGSTVVHSIGGWCALVTLIKLGPRNGRFDSKPFPLQSSGMPFAVLGTLLLFFGWFGFNAGSALVLDGHTGKIIMNTVLGGSAGGLAVLLLMIARPRLATIVDVLNGCIAGLVAITASANVAVPAAAVFVGAVGGLVAVFGRHLLESFRIDDVVGAVPVHLFGGIWGTLAVAFVTPIALLPAGHTLYSQLFIQTLGIAVAGAWAFGGFGLVVLLLDRFFCLRVDADAERRGLNLAMHGVVTDLAVLTGRLGLYRKTADVTDLFDASETDIGDVARDFNRAVDRFRVEVTRARHRLTDPTAAGDVPSPDRMRAIEREEDELKIAAEEVNLVSDQIAQSAPLVGGSIAPKDRYIRALQATFAAPIRDLADLERRIRSERDDTAIEAMIETARDRSAVLARKLASFVDFADAATAEHPPKRVAFSLRDMIADVVGDFAPRAAVANVMLAWSVEDGAQRIAAHPTSIRKMLRKLVDNAIRFNQDGGLVEITVKLDDKARICIEVADTGCGMSQAHIRALLDPFRAIDGNGHVGVGLALIDRLAVLHGGRFSLQSKAGIGTRAFLLLPIDERAAANA